MVITFQIVGELDQQTQLESRSIIKQEDDSYIVQGYISIREINRHLQIELPLDKSKTLSGLITQHLNALPSKNTSLLIKGYQIEILQVKDSNKNQCFQQYLFSKNVQLDY